MITIEQTNIGTSIDRLPAALVASRARGTATGAQQRWPGGFASARARSTREKGSWTRIRASLFSVFGAGSEGWPDLGVLDDVSLDYIHDVSVAKVCFDHTVVSSIITFEWDNCRRSERIDSVATRSNHIILG